MSHLSGEILYRLAGLVVWDMGFEEEDARNMRHMLECESCYRRLCANMAMMEALDDIGLSEAVPAREKKAPAPVKRIEPRKIASEKKRTARVEIGLTVCGPCPALEVVSASGGWSFVAAELVCAKGEKLALCPPTRLEDLADPGTFVEVDQEDQRLVVRLSDSQWKQNPQATLLLSGGRSYSLPLSRGSTKLPTLPEGRYRLLLEK